EAPSACELLPLTVSRSAKKRSGLVEAEDRRRLPDRFGPLEACAQRSCINLTVSGEVVPLNLITEVYANYGWKPRTTVTCGAVQEKFRYLCPCHRNVQMLCRLGTRDPSSASVPAHLFTFQSSNMRPAARNQDDKIDPSFAKSGFRRESARDTGSRRVHL